MNHIFYKTTVGDDEPNLCSILTNLTRESKYMYAVFYDQVVLAREKCEVGYCPLRSLNYPCRIYKKLNGKQLKFFIVE
jgi:hypothetical protein